MYRKCAPNFPVFSFILYYIYLLRVNQQPLMAVERREEKKLFSHWKNIERVRNKMS